MPLVYHTRSVPLSNQLREVVEKQERDFPHVVMDAELSAFAGRCSPWHWHGEFEFAFVAQGKLEMRTQGMAAELESGDAYFVNTNVLHRCAAAQDAQTARLHVHLFGRELVAGTGLTLRRYVKPLEDSSGLEMMVFRRGECCALTQALEAAFRAAKEEVLACEMQIAAHMTAAWRELYAAALPLMNGKGMETREDVMRMKQMLRFIHENYHRAIDVSNIAAAAGVSQRECYRCFSRVLDTTPRSYLTKYRVDAAARMLAEGDESVTKIALDCGFSTPSYFGKVFKSLVGCSPRAFCRI